MASSRSTGTTPTEEMTSPSAERVGREEATAASSAGRAVPPSGGTPVRTDRRPAAAGVRVGGDAPATGAAKSGGATTAAAPTGEAPASEGAAKVKGSTAATPRAGGAASPAPGTPKGATKSSVPASATPRGKAARRSRPASGATPRRESSAAGQPAMQPPPPPRRSKSTAGSATASRASSAAGWSADDHAAAPTTAAARVPLPPSRPGTPPAATAATAAAPAVGGEDPMEQDAPPPVPRRVRPLAVEEAEPAGGETGALVQWMPPHAPGQFGECRLRALYEAIPVPKQGPAWQPWLTCHPVQYELPAGVTADLPALLEAADAPWVERVAVRLSNVMDEATAGDVTPVVAWEWACCSPPYLGERDPHFHQQDACTERRVRDASGILVSSTHVESTQIHVFARRDYYVPTPTWWSALVVPHGFPARMPRIVAYFGTVRRRGESTPAAAILATQLVLEVAGVCHASARTKGFLWHLPTGVVDSLVELHLANLAEGADPEAQAYLSVLLDLHQSLDWAAAGPYLARRVGGEDDGTARAFVHCDKRLVEGRIGLHEGLGDPSYPYAAGVTATSAPPESGWGALGAVSPYQRKRTRGAAERPSARGGAVRRTARAGPSPVGPAARPTFAPPGVPYYPALGAGKNLSWGYVTLQCARSLATTYPTAAGTLRVAHGEPIVASLVDTLAWVTRGAGAVLRGSPSPLSAAAQQFLVVTTPEAIGYQMASGWRDTVSG